MVLFDAPMGNWDAGDRGLAAVPGREKEFRDSLARVVEYGHALDCDTVHHHGRGGRAGLDYQAAERTTWRTYATPPAFWKGTASQL